ncbi:VOC family protein [Cognatishimia sp. F0-27]|uniref:VOC family protein n=1 Tax=Cognatishimia sp. F0-27 TaxID=2816855 RepID=UPI001D0C60B9|nr:VOC family protein [Cognatishimia sp. F0-27]MCC1491130.1 VOC family protein [Cognatishimia sp. F0-27]
MTRSFTVQGLGEIAIRCRDFDAMVRFYRDVIGLETVENGHRDGIHFFHLHNGVAGHTCVLALFRSKTPPVTGAPSSLHHLALSLPYAEQDAVMDWYRARGIPFSVQEFDWIGWRGIFTRDPDGNTVELVARDPAHAPPAP